MNDETLLTQDDLRPGDVLLHLGRGDLSELIAWAGDGQYSHAAMVLDAHRLIEAGPSGVVEVDLRERLRQVSSYHFIDAFRRRQPAPLPATSIDALRQTAMAYLGRPYPMDQLIQLGLACAVRNKLSDDPALRLLLRLAVDAFLGSEDQRVVCSELVYRCFDEAATRPPQALRLTIDLAAVPHQPWPEGVDLVAFLKRHGIDLPALIHDWLRRQPADQRQALTASRRADEGTAGSTLLQDADPATQATPASDDDLENRFALARSRLGIASASQRLARAPSGEYLPNPKAVLPADLEYSPDLQRVGRVRMEG